MSTSAGRNWYEVYLMVLTVLFVVSAWSTDSARETLTATFPVWSQNLWYGGLIVSATLVLTGIVLGTVTGLMIERAALLVLTGLCVGYGLVFFAVAGRGSASHGIYVVVLVLAYAAVNITRAFQINTDLRQIRSSLHQLAERPVTTVVVTDPVVRS
jgi:hypothetical protein